MKKLLIKHVVISLIATTSMITLPMGIGLSFDGDDIKINGKHIIDKYTAAEAILGLSGSYIGSRLFSNASNQDLKMAAIWTGAAAGSCIADVICSKVTQRRCLEKVSGPMASLLLGTYGTNCGIPNPIAFGGHFGKAIVSQMYGDTKITKIHLGKAVGEQCGILAFSEGDSSSDKTFRAYIGKVVGGNIGAALASRNDTHLRDSYIKKVAVQLVIAQAARYGAKQIVGPKDIQFYKNDYDLLVIASDWMADQVSDQLVQ